MFNVTEDVVKLIVKFDEGVMVHVPQVDRATLLTLDKFIVVDPPKAGLIAKLLGG